MSKGQRNIWRTKVPARTDWADRLKYDAPNKYLVVSCDSHVNEPLDFYEGRVDRVFVERLPQVKTDVDGTQWLVSEAGKPQLVRIPNERSDLLMKPEEYESFDVSAPYTERMEEEDVMRASAGRSLDQRVEHARSQGVDAEIIFGNKGLMGFCTPDPVFAGVMCRAWNRWAHEYFYDYPTFLPMAMIAPGVIDEAIAEVRWAVDNGFKGLLLPNRPIYHRRDQPRNTLDYNDKQFEALWSAITEAGLPVTLHVSTGEDPRAVGGNGGAITNFVCHSMTTTLEPLVQLITSGVFERHPTLRVGTVESGIGWLPWLLQQMDYAYDVHHMWVRPVIPELPSHYYRKNCFSTFIEEPNALRNALAEGLENNVLWSSDYPHHEGTFPHTDASIQRVFEGVSEQQRQKVLGLNAAKIFNLDGIIL